MTYKTLIYSTKYEKDFGRNVTFEAKDLNEAIKKCDSLAIRLCHGRKDEIAYTKPQSI